MVIAGISPTMASCLRITSPLAGSVPTTTPRTGYGCEVVLLPAGAFAVPRQPVIPKAIAAIATSNRTQDERTRMMNLLEARAVAELPVHDNRG